MWMRLKHPNVVQCLGATVNPSQIVMDWMPNGDVMDYMRNNRGASRVHLVSFPVFNTEGPRRSTWSYNFRYQV